MARHPKISADDILRAFAMDFQPELVFCSDTSQITLSIPWP